VSGFGIGLQIGVHNFYFTGMNWTWSSWKIFGLDQDCKISRSVHHCSVQHARTWREVRNF